MADNKDSAISGNSNDRDSEGLTQGYSSGYYTCEICDSPTRNSPIPLRYSEGDATGAGSAIELQAYDSCRMNLANVVWGDYING